MWPIQFCCGGLLNEPGVGNRESGDDIKVHALTPSKNWHHSGISREQAAALEKLAKSRGIAAIARGGD